MRKKGLVLLKKNVHLVGRVVNRDQVWKFESLRAHFLYPVHLVLLTSIGHTCQIPNWAGAKMGFLNPNSDLRETVHSRQWIDGSRCLDSLSDYMSRLVTDLNQWMVEDCDPLKRHDDVSSRDAVFEQYIDESVVIANKVELWKREAQKSATRDSKKAINYLLDSINLAVSACQTMLLVGALWKIERPEVKEAKWRDWIGNSNFDVYELRNRVAQATVDPQWRILIPLQPGPNPIPLITQRIQMAALAIQVEIQRYSR